MKNLPYLLILPLLAAPATAAAQWFDDCAHRAERTATVPAARADLLRLAARAGSLRVEGRPGLSEVRVRGEACASSESYLEAIQLVTERSGGEVRVEVQMPEMRGIGRMYSRLDLVVEVPQGLALDVTDSSGEAEFRGVATLRLEDSSGEIEVADVAGDVQIDDSSGEIRVRGVRGDLRLRDSSGGIEVSGVQGAVLVERDGSGEIRIADVGRDVRIERDSSGSIEVWDVRGDFVVERDGSGRIRHRDVGGSVSIPRRR
jgi:hypothetical protein